MNLIQKGNQARNQNNKKKEINIKREIIAKLLNEEPQMTISEIAKLVNTFRNMVYDVKRHIERRKSILTKPDIHFKMTEIISNFIESRTFTDPSLICNQLSKTIENIYGLIFIGLQLTTGENNKVFLFQNILNFCA